MSKNDQVSKREEKTTFPSKRTDLHHYLTKHPHLSISKRFEFFSATVIKDYHWKTPDVQAYV